MEEFLYYLQNCTVSFLLGVFLASRREVFQFLTFIGKKFNNIIPIIFRIKSNNKCQKREKHSTVNKTQ